MPKCIGIRITYAKKDRLVGELDVDKRHLNNTGHVHGVALAAFADDLGGRLAGLNVPSGAGQPRLNPTRISFESASLGGLPGLLWRSMLGQRMIVIQTLICRPDGKLAAMMIQTQMVLPKESVTSPDEGGEAYSAPSVQLSPACALSVLLR
jgi:1,4-dihydroxy-2-naphthoyl-CoA hydrolase